MNKFKEEKGITVIALIITIIIMLILAGVTIDIAIDGDLFDRAQSAVDRTNEKVTQTQTKVDELMNEWDRIEQNQQNNGNNEPQVRTLAQLVGANASNDKQTVSDKYGNQVVIPAGFIVVANGTDGVTYGYTGNTSEPSVQDGIVIKNATDGNEFVWVPVGTINNKEGDPNGATTQIKLGRYSFASSTGNETLQQEASKTVYDTAVEVSDGYEVSSNYTGTINSTQASSFTNAKALNLGEWLSTALDNKGYYIARYEASTYDDAGTKACSKQSTSINIMEAVYEGNQVWNQITENQASEVSQAAYPNSSGATFYSDLVNSYAWDTALVFIQKYADSDYSKQTSVNSDYTNTGTTGDKVCNIYDLASNFAEWTTETYYESDIPPVLRGGGCGCYWVTTPGARGGYAANRDMCISFRMVLCVK